MKSWDKEGILKVDLPYLLPALNEALQFCPVLLQAFGYGANGVDPPTVDVVFPVEDCLVPESANECEFHFYLTSEV